MNIQHYDADTHLLVPREGAEDHVLVHKAELARLKAESARVSLVDAEKALRDLLSIMYEHPEHGLCTGPRASEEIETARSVLRDLARQAGGKEQGAEAHSVDRYRGAGPLASSAPASPAPAACEHTSVSVRHGGKTWTCDRCHGEWTNGVYPTEANRLNKPPASAEWTAQQYAQARSVALNTVAEDPLKMSTEDLGRICAAIQRAAPHFAPRARVRLPDVVVDITQMVSSYRDRCAAALRAQGIEVIE